jgi:sterol desaturase/sphingolipid hydroxylase (fatty acid hydroxylase superfamily)
VNVSEKVVIVALMVVNGVSLCLMERHAPHTVAPRGQGGRRMGTNLALTALLIALNLTFDRAAVALGARNGDFGLLGRAALPPWASLLAVIVALDGLAYLAHVLMHALPPAWRFHRVHHSDVHVDVTTAFRQHPLETAWRYSFQLAGALALGASSTSVALYLALSALNAQIEHADVALPWKLDRALRVLLATPAMHRVHHSRAQAETDTNYANIFSFWDRLFGTYRAPRPGQQIAFGLEGYETPEEQRPAGLLALPFRP